MSIVDVKTGVLACLTDDEDDVGWFMQGVDKMDSESECSVQYDDGDTGEVSL